MFTFSISAKKLSFENVDEVVTTPLLAKMWMTKVTKPTWMPEVITILQKAEEPFKTRMICTTANSKYVLFLLQIWKLFCLLQYIFLILQCKFGHLSCFIEEFRFVERFDMTKYSLRWWWKLGGTQSWDELVRRNI